MKAPGKAEMESFTITFSRETAEALQELATRCTEGPARTGKASLNVSSLLAMLAENAAMVVTRPGSWEGSGMAQLLRSHGYEV